MALKEVIFWTEFLKLYRSLPAVWQVKSKAYGSRALKAAAYDKLVKKLKAVDRHANREAVVRKINTFRTVYRRDLRKMSENPKYKSNLWYFDLLHSFLKDQKTNECDCTASQIAEMEPILLMPENVIDSDDDDDVEVDIAQEEEEGDVKQNIEIKEEEAEADDQLIVSRQLTHIDCSSDTNPQLAKRRKAFNDSLQFAECESSSYLQQEQKQNNDISMILARTWASQYEELSNNQKILARKMISDIFFFGCLNQLDETHPIQLQQIVSRY